MKTAIYKGKSKQDSYLYLEQEEDFSRVPQPLLAAMGELALVMTLDLSPEQKLARADVEQVISALQQDGFYLQMPDEAEKLALAGKKPVSNPIPKL